MKKSSLLLLFTRNVSLKQWVDSGLFYREKLLYERFIKEEIIGSVIWATYGGSSDAEMASMLIKEGKLDPRIKVITKPGWWIFGNFTYSLFLAIIHFDSIKKVDFIKSNQLDGAWAGGIAKILNPATKFILRSGYNLLFLYLKERKFAKYHFFRILLKLPVSRADYIIVTSQDHKDYFIDHYSLLDEKIQVIGNYIDQTKFGPRPLDLNRRTVFLGRFEQIKNVINLIDAAIEEDIQLDLIGKGSLQPMIEAKIKDHPNIRVLGTFPNDQIPFLLQQYTFFMMPSYSEGNPKALLEAMSVGLVSVGTKVPGIQEILEDGFNGIIAGSTDVASLRAAMIRTKTEDIASLQKMSQNARAYIQKNHTLDSIVKTEASLIGY